jgi:hypothetical protein
MVAQSFDLRLACTFLRLHLCPQIKMRVASTEVEIPRRSIGVLTGSRSASAAGRIPLLDATRARSTFWKSKCFATDDRKFALASFVDNLLSPATTPKDAIDILEDCESYLKRNWKLQYGEDSKEYLMCRGHPHYQVCVPGWKHVTCMKSLGHHLDENGGIKSCFSQTIGAMWRSFFGNYGKGLRKCTKVAKMRFLRSSISPIASFRWARWPYQVTYASKLDTVQRQMIGMMMGIRPRPHEDAQDFTRRRRLTTGHVASRHGRWSAAWRDSLMSWHAHVTRNHDTKAWSLPLLEWHSDDWLDEQRLLSSSGPTESRTDTRARSGKPHKRWSEGLQQAAIL